MTVPSLTLDLPSEVATEQLGQVLSGLLHQIAIITLSGDLGTGKTTLVRALLRSLGHQGRVKSPTYALVESYPETMPPIHHFDLYRLADPEELEFLGFSDYLESGALLLIEWPERGGAWLPVADLHIHMHHQDSGRRVQLVAGTSAGETLIEALAQRWSSVQ